MHESHERSRWNFELQAPHSSTHEDVLKVVARLVEIGRKSFFHANRRTSAANISGRGQQLFHVNHLHFLVSAHFGRLFQVDLFGARDDAHEEARLVATQNESFEHLLDVLPYCSGKVLGSQIVLVDFIGHEFIGYARVVEQSRSIGFYLFFCHIKSVYPESVIRIWVINTKVQKMCHKRAKTEQIEEIIKIITKFAMKAKS